MSAGTGASTPYASASASRQNSSTSLVVAKETLAPDAPSSASHTEQHQQYQPDVSTPRTATSATTATTGARSSSVISEEIATDTAGLNAKLVRAIERQAELEHSAASAREELAALRARHDALEAAQREHDRLLADGALLLKADVDQQRAALQGKLDAEIAARAAADRAKTAIERELEDLTRSLFEEANKMVYDKNVENADLQSRNAKLQQQLKDDGLLLDIQRQQLDELKSVMQRMQEAEDSRQNSVVAAQLVHARKESGGGGSGGSGPAVGLKSPSRTSSPRPGSRNPQNRLSHDYALNVPDLGGRGLTPTQINFATPSPLTQQTEFGSGKSTPDHSTAAGERGLLPSELQDAQASYAAADDIDDVSTNAQAGHVDLPETLRFRTDTAAFQDFVQLLQAGQQFANATRAASISTSSNTAAASASGAPPSAIGVFKKPEMRRTASGLSIDTSSAAGASSLPAVGSGKENLSRPSSRPASPGPMSATGFFGLMSSSAAGLQLQLPSSASFATPNFAQSHPTSSAQASTGNDAQHGSQAHSQPHGHGYAAGHARQPSAPSLREQKYLKRVMQEDIEPTLRLDLSPDLGYLARRALPGAIVDGALVIERQPGHLRRYKPERVQACALCGERRDQEEVYLRSSRFRLSDKTDATNYAACGFCKDRLVACCEFAAFVRNIARGLYATSPTANVQSHAAAAVGADEGRRSTDSARLADSSHAAINGGGRRSHDDSRTTFANSSTGAAGAAGAEGVQRGGEEAEESEAERLYRECCNLRRRMFEAKLGVLPVVVVVNPAINTATANATVANLKVDASTNANASASMSASANAPAPAMAHEAARGKNGDDDEARAALADKTAVSATTHGVEAGTGAGSSSGSSTAVA